MPRPTRGTVHYCDPGYTLDPDRDTCTRPSATAPTEITVHGCPAVPPGEPQYRLTTTVTATGTARACERTVTVAAETAPACPEPPDGEDPYTLTVTTDSDGRTTHSCTRPADDDEGDAE